MISSSQAGLEELVNQLWGGGLFSLQPRKIFWIFLISFLFFTKSAHTSYDVTRKKQVLLISGPCFSLCSRTTFSSQKTSLLLLSVHLTMPPPKHNLFGFTKEHYKLIIPIVGLIVGKKIADLESERKVRFRDRSLLYGQPSPSEIPSWPQKWWPI